MGSLIISIVFLITAVVENIAPEFEDIVNS